MTDIIYEGGGASMSNSIRIYYCNNIVEGNITLEEDMLNIKPELFIQFCLTAFDTT